MNPVTLYAVLKLGVDVFVLEQGSPYQELDGRDTNPGPSCCGSKKMGKSSPAYGSW